MTERAVDIIEAERLIRDLADDITAEVRAKGYERATVEFWVGSRKTQVTWIFSGMSDRKCGWSDDISAAANDARSYVDALEDARAYDADFSAPLFLLSEQRAEAAE